MIRRPPISTRTDTLFPYTTRFRSRGRIENILDAAKASKHIASPWENPARWKGNLIHLLPRRKNKKQVRHHPAIPYEEMPDLDRKSTRLNSSHYCASRMPSSA